MCHATASALLSSVNQTSHRYLLLACSGVLLQIYLGWKLLPEKHYNFQLSNLRPRWPGFFLEDSIPRVWSQRTKWWREMKILSLRPVFFSFGEMNTCSLHFLQYLKLSRKFSCTSIHTFGCSTVKTAIYTFRYFKMLVFTLDRLYYQ